MEKYKFARKFWQNSVYIIVITNKYEGAKNLWNKDGGGKEENMSEGLLKIFIKDYKNVKDIKVRENYGIFAGIVGIICNLILFACKFFAGIITGSVSISADAFNNLSDAGSSIVTLAGFKMAGKPADTDHPFGHGRIEYIAGMIVGNARLAYRKETNTFMNGLTWLFQIIMFLTLGLLVNPHEMLDISVTALLIGVFMILIARPVSVFLCLLPFKGITNKARVFISWVGLRGAVPIIFATYPVIAQIPGSNQLFNIVFFITLLSLTIQGMTISKMARWLKLDLPEEKEGNEFGVELPEEIDTHLDDITLTEDMLSTGNRLADMNIPKGTLVMLIKRGNEFIIPNGQIELHAGDKLLVMSEKK